MTPLIAQAPPHSSVSPAMRAALQMYAWCVLSLSVAACGPAYGNEPEPGMFDDDPRSTADIAADIYEIEHEPLRDECLQYAYDAEFISMDPGALGVQCGTEMHAAVACFFKFDIHGAKFAILDTEADTKVIQVHEYLHFMLQCQARDSEAADPLHLDSVWDHVDQSHGQHAERRD
jgi:hypothetical protein